MGAQAAAGQEQLGDLQEEEGDRRIRLVALGYLRDGHQEALDLVGDLDREVVGMPERCVPRAWRAGWSGWLVACSVASDI